jgi:hypothetical protein
MSRTRYYATLFDSAYLTRGLALYESLKLHSSVFHLYIFAFDAITDDILRTLMLEDVTIISLEEFETPELIMVKKERSKAEYCWTCTPSVILYVLNKFDVTECTYLDSDLYFYSDPSALILEMEQAGKNILITEHRFSLLTGLFELKRAGRFCVQFMTFRNEESSLKVLERWRMQCIDWCYARYEDGKFGDQKYIEEWPNIYQNIHILQHPGGGIAPWNILQYSFNNSGDLLKGRKRSNGTTFDVVFFHFQYVKLLDNGFYDIGWYIIPSSVRKLLYIPYLNKLKDIENRLKNKLPVVKTGMMDFKVNRAKDIIKTGLKKIFGYNIMKMY